ncbi:MAG: PIN domain-containing protein [Anaerolineales bacterium]|nr:PIN domain-containing protein [Anaerolineales bacterium]
MTPRIFIDSSVLFSAAYSSKGHSRDLLLMGATGEIKIIISNFVLQETIRNLSGLKKPPLEELDQIVQNANIELVDATKQSVLDAAKLIVWKDAPIIAAAKTAKVNMLVSLDKKHILGRTDLEAYINASIVTPLVAFQTIRNPK